jgi:hypothetical protein
MECAFLGLFIFGLIMIYKMWQGARAQIKYRQEVQSGNMAVITEVVDAELERWRSQRPPRGIPLAVWNGVRAMELVSLDAEGVHVNCSAEGQYRMLDGRWQEVSSPLQEGMAVAAKAIEMLLYDIPHFRPQRVRADIYTTFRDPGGDVTRGCILTCTTDRERARAIDWDNMSPREIVDTLGAYYETAHDGRALPIAGLD